MKIEILIFNALLSAIISYKVYVRTQNHKNEYYDGFLVYLSIFANTFLLACIGSVIYRSIWNC